VVRPERQFALAAEIPGASVWPVAGDHAACVTDAATFVPVLLDACRWVVARAGA
jgi:hypothetical protein